MLAGCKGLIFCTRFICQEAELLAMEREEALNAAKEEAMKLGLPVPEDSTDLEKGLTSSDSAYIDREFHQSPGGMNHSADIRWAAGMTWPLAGVCSRSLYPSYSEAIVHRCFETEDTFLCGMLCKSNVLNYWLAGSAKQYQLCKPSVKTGWPTWVGRCEIFEPMYSNQQTQTMLAAKILRIWH